MAVSVVSFSFSRAAQPEAQRPSSLLNDGFLYWILSATSLDPNSSDFQLNRGPEGPFGLVCLPLLHLVSNWSGFLSWLSYILVQRPLNLWNGMFDRHQPEITVMQFTGHSLLVHQSMSVPWDFFTLSHFISQIPPTRFLSITSHWDVSLPSGASLWNGISARVEGQNTTQVKLSEQCRCCSKKKIWWESDPKELIHILIGRRKKSYNS